MSDNLDALNRVRPEPGWIGSFVREQAPGALATGTRVIKARSEPGDTFPDGLGSIGPGPDVPVPTPHGSVPPGAYVYFVEWEPRPRCAIAITSTRIDAA